MTIEIPAYLAVMVIVGLGVVLLLRKRGNAAGQRSISERNTDPRHLEAEARREVEAGRLELAYELYLRAQRPERAAQIAQRLGRLREAAELLERCGERARAAAIYRQLGLKHKVKELGADTTIPDPSMPIPQPKPKSAIERARAYEREFEEARRKAESGDGAARQEAETAGRQAAEAYLEAGDVRRAADICKNAGLIDQAVNLYVNLLGDPGSAAPLFAAKGEHRRAAEMYASAGQKERALGAWVEWGRVAPDPLAHTNEIERLGDGAMVKMLESVVTSRPIDPKNLDLHYRIGCELEDRGASMIALPVFEGIRAIEPRFRELEKKIGELRVRIDTSMVKPGSPGPAIAVAAPKPSASATPAAQANVQAPTPMAGLESKDIEKLVSDAAAKAAEKAVVAALSVSVAASAHPRRTALSLVNPAIDVALEAAKVGPSIDELQRRIGGAAPATGNVELYYELALAEMAAGLWDKARSNFDAVEKVKPGHADVADRISQIDAWKRVAPSLVPKPNQSKDERAGRYTLLGELGRGGMAVVYRARDEALGREVAIKFLAAESAHEEMMLNLFQREARAVASLNHPNIITVYDVGVLEGKPFLCMELVDGVTVEKELERTGRFKIVEAVEICEQVLVALEYAHGKKIVHRDIKPANVMRLRSGLVKLMDFGLAKSIEGGAKTTLIAGTPAYMAPEQFTGRNVDHRTDLFAVGAMLYELVTGKLPFETMARERPPVGCKSINNDVPKLLERVVSRAIDFDPSKRFQSASEMAQPLSHIVQSVRAFQGQGRGQGATPHGTGNRVAAGQIGGNAASSPATPALAAAPAGAVAKAPAPEPQKEAAPLSEIALPPPRKPRSVEPEAAQPAAPEKTPPPASAPLPYVAPGQANKTMLGMGAAWIPTPAKPTAPATPGVPNTKEPNVSLPDLPPPKSRG